MTVSQILGAYLLEHEVEPITATQYRRCLKVFCSWAGGDVPAEQFTIETVNRFLLAKQEGGRSGWYRSSLRNVLRLLLRYHYGDELRGTLRSVKLEELEPEAWTPAEVTALIAAARQLHPDDSYFPTLIRAGYETGLERVDLQRLERRHIMADGSIPFARHKTGKRVLVWIPRDFLAIIDHTRPKTGPLWPWDQSHEWFRKKFAGIVKAAGVAGTFKRLRKSAGTWVEADHPGRGHEYLGHSRKIFETHYSDRRQYAVAPIMPRPLAPPPRGRDAG